MTGTLHIIGGGLSGLSAAVEACGCGKEVILHEASAHFGGRARAFFDKTLGRKINNGNHLFFNANKALLRYIDLIGAMDTITGPKAPLFPFYDCRDDTRWTFRLPYGGFLGALRHPPRGFKNIHLCDLKNLYHLLKARPGQTVADFLNGDDFSRTFIAPLAIAVLNTMPDEGSACLLANVLKETLQQGKDAFLPRFPKDNLDETLVAPALGYLKLLHKTVLPQHRLTGLKSHHGRIHALLFGNEEIKLNDDDRVIFALPANVAHQLLKDHIPGFTTPCAFESIINLHYRLPQRLHPLTTLAQSRFIGVIDGVSEWIFINDDMISVTISAANRFLDCDMEALKGQVWEEVREICSVDLQQPLPQKPQASRLICEKRATFKADPAQDRLRVGAATPLVNLALCGDWTDTFLPATLEGATRSGVTAVNALGLKEPSRP